MTFRNLYRSLAAPCAAFLLAGAALAQEAKKDATPTPMPAAPAAAAPAAEATPAPAAVPAPAVEAAPAPAAAPAPKVEAESFARIYVYREKRFMGAALHHDIFLDGKQVAELGNGSYFILKATPGQHKLRGEEEKEEVAVTVEAGKTYYFRTELVAGFMKGHGKVNSVEEAAATKEFKEWLPKLKYCSDLKLPELFEKL